MVNDVAERSIKTMADFNDTITNDENQKQKLLQIVEDHRKRVPKPLKKLIIL